MSARAISILLLSGSLGLALSLPAMAQKDASSGQIAQPDYGSGASSGDLSNLHFNTPESDGRPGVQFYAQGMYAYHQGDYQHAVQQLKISAAWAYKPAEYNLAVMYFQGDGVSVNRPLGAAWMFLAAERGTPLYVSARHMIVGSLSSDERAKAYSLMQELETTYGDKVALRRAKAQWARAKIDQTGSRVGGTVGELHVGVAAAHGAHNAPTGNSAGAGGLTKGSWMDVMKGGGSTDGAIAYQQLQQSANPYDPVFLKGRVGTATVGPLAPVSANDSTKTSKPSEQELKWCNKDGCS